MLIVHHLNNSRSQRILWLLEELEVPYELKKYQRTKEQTAPKELLDIHPLGKSPVITDGDVTLAESGAIVEYIIMKYGQGKADPPESGKIDNLYFTHYCEGSLMPLLVNRLVFSLVPGRSPFFVRPLVKTIFGQLDKLWLGPSIKANLDYIEAHLQKTNGLFAGGDNFTAADYMMSFPLEGLAAGDENSVTPAIKAFIKRVHERLAYKKALEKGGDYAYAKL